jgi:hypothetical protein
VRILRTPLAFDPPQVSLKLLPTEWKRGLDALFSSFGNSAAAAPSFDYAGLREPQDFAGGLDSLRETRQAAVTVPLRYAKSLDSTVARHRAISKFDLVLRGNMHKGVVVRGQGYPLQIAPVPRPKRSEALTIDSELLTRWN